MTRVIARWLPLFCFAWICLASSPALGQGGSVVRQIIAPPEPVGVGQPSPQATFRVCTAVATGNPCSPLVSNIYSDQALSNPIPNPGSTDGNGMYSFFIATGEYLIQEFPQIGTTYSYLVFVNGTGTVSSVGISVGTSPLFSVSGSPITTTGTLTLTPIMQSGNLVFGNCLTSVAPPAFCSLTAAMIPGTLNSTTISGNLSVTGTLGVTAATTLGSTLGVTGATTLSSTLGVTGATTLSSTLTVAGLTTINNNEIVNGTLNAGPITSTGGVSGTTGTFTSTVTASNVGMLNGPGSYVILPNSVVGTTLNTLTKLTGTQAVVAATTDTNGAIGITVSGAGSTGTNATVQMSGEANCVFDGAVAAGDYVQISPTVTGNCHDSGVAPPNLVTSGQVIGQAVLNGFGAGTYSILLHPVNRSSGTVCVATVPVTVNANTTGPQVINTCQFQSAALNVLGKTIRLRSSVHVIPSTSSSAVSFGIGTTSAIGTNIGLASATSSSTQWGAEFDVLCTTTTTGASGVFSCSPVVTNGSTASPLVAADLITLSTDLTGVVYVGTLCSFGTASSSNSCKGIPFTVEQLN